MFYLNHLSKDICVSPKEITGKLEDILSENLKKLEGTILGTKGYVIKILKYTQTSNGKIDNETGFVLFGVDYVAVTFKLDQGEILSACPYLINEHGFYCRVGEAQIFVSRHMIKNWYFDPDSNVWISKNTGNSVKLNKPIYLKIVKSKINFEEITSLAVILE